MWRRRGRVPAAALFIAMLGSGAGVSAVHAKKAPRSLSWSVVRTDIKASTGWALQIGALDLDGDGDLDVIQFENNAYQIDGKPKWADTRYRGRTTAWENDGTGQFRKLKRRQWLRGRPGRVDDPNERPMIHDFNGDGLPDVYVAQHGWELDHPVRGALNLLLLSQPDGRLRFELSAPYPAAENAYTHSAAIADVDGDGDLDIWDGNWPDGNWGLFDRPDLADLGARLLINDGSGGFEGHSDTHPQFCPTPDEGECIAFPREVFCDVDRDGDVDLIGSTYESPIEEGAPLRNLPVRVLENDGSGFFTFWDGKLPKPHFAKTGTGRLVCADLDLDGHNDVLVWEQEGARADGSGEPGASRLAFWRNKRAGVFKDLTKRLQQSFPPGSSNVDVWAIDMNNDGRPDILADGHVQPARVFINRGKGRFREQVLAWPPGFFEDWPDFDSTQGAHLLPFDANGDARVDILVTGSRGRHFLLINETRVPATGRQRRSGR